MALKVFVDFDGTITRKDVGNAFFRKYIGRTEYDEMLREYLDERITARECFRRGIASIKSLNAEQATDFVRSQEIDPSFNDFVSFCRERDVEFHIVSDGLDFYINEILAAHAITGVSVFANTLRFVPVDGVAHADLKIEFPYSDAECGRCACCKRNIMLTHSGEEDIIAYVGEGYSDRCPVRYADVVFAKDALQTYCQQENISYFLYDSFGDVIKRLNMLLAKKRIRKRLAAEMKRKELFMREP